MSFFQSHQPGEQWPSLNQLLADDARLGEVAGDACLTTVFGDGYCLAQSANFRFFRHQALVQGVCFVDEEVGHSRSFPLAALPTMLAENRIPYVPNRRALEAIADGMGHRLTPWHLAKLGVQSNVLHHETVHLVANARFMADIDPRRVFRDVTADQQARHLLLLNLCEALASAAEAWASFEILERRFDAQALLMLKLGFYFYLESEHVQQLGELRDRFGPRDLFLHLWIAYWLSLSYPEWNDQAADIHRSMLQQTAGGEGQALLSVGRSVIDNAFKLNTNFRQNVSRFYWALVGMGDAADGSADEPANPFEQAADQWPELLPTMASFVDEMFADPAGGGAR